jgi:tetratricopeptide (TPR) repeat protein
VDGRLGVGMARHNIGLARLKLGDVAGALEEFDRARAYYEPIIRADPANAWAEGSLADVLLVTGQARESLVRASAGAPDSAAACALYSRAAAIYEKLRAAGRLTAMRMANSAEAAAAAARCRSSGARESSSAQ